MNCHGENGSGGTKQVFSWRELAPGTPQELFPANLALGRTKRGTEPEQLFQRITIGVPGAFGETNLMLSFANLSEADRWALVHYLKEEILP